MCVSFSVPPPTNNNKKKLTIVYGQRKLDLPRANNDIICRLSYNILEN